MVIFHSKPLVIARGYHRWLISRYPINHQISHDRVATHKIPSSSTCQDELRRKTQGYLPECDVAFIDEIFKALRWRRMRREGNGYELTHVGPTTLNKHWQLRRTYQLQLTHDNMSSKLIWVDPCWWRTYQLNCHDILGHLGKAFLVFLDGWTVWLVNVVGFWWMGRVAHLHIGHP